MIKKSLFLICILFTLKGSAQNLVPNFGFEDYDTCPQFGDQIEFCTGWKQYSTESFPETTPDYYNSCSPSSNMGVPQSYFLYQTDHRNCNAFIGLITWAASTPEYREHAGIELNQPLILGQKYFLSFNAVLGGYGGYGDTTWYYDVPSNKIGLRLSTIPYSSTNPVPIDNYDHLHSELIISDTVNWLRISGSIEADSAYKYVILGNFHTDSNTDTISQTCFNCTNEFSYFLIDDVCISTDSSFCNGSIDFLPCQVTINENNFYSPFSIFPNPAKDYIIIKSYFKSTYDLTIYNSIGEELPTNINQISENLKLDISSYNSNLLFLKISTEGKQFIYKILKN